MASKTPQPSLGDMGIDGSLSNTSYKLSDRYTADAGEVFMSGLHALVRIPIEQLIVDRRSGLSTAAYVTGYPGSPVGGFTDVVNEAFQIRSDLPVMHQMALNEEYAATAVMGTQLAAAQSDARYQGVIGMWYGKAPGVDRAVDALRHGCYVGASRFGGVVCIVGDDPGAKSSTLPSSSAGVLADLHIPVLYPGSPQEALDLGRHAIALSRSTGLWTALKIVADVADSTESFKLDPDRVSPILPMRDGQPYFNVPNGEIITPRTLDIEREIYDVRYPLSVEYAHLNKLNKVTVSGSSPIVGIVAPGNTYNEVRAALQKLGFISDHDIENAGIRLFKMLMPLPFDSHSVRAFAEGLKEIIVVEEKNPNVETLIKDALYASPIHPIIVGKYDNAGRPLIPGHGSLIGDIIAPHLFARLEPWLGARIKPPHEKRERISLAVGRTPFYCSGCPHNRSTRVPDGMSVGVGIGCHSMVSLMSDKRVGNLIGITPMGNEGMQWVGMSPYVVRQHLVQNLGDGTFYHSGRLAIGAAIASGVNMTYKLLYNDAIGMTGGQRSTGRSEVTAIARQMLDLGVKRVLITTDDVKKYKQIDLPPSVDVWPRTRLDEAHNVLANEVGVTMLIHDQACAAEARRQRKRGLIKTPAKRIVINDRICEGCGHCGEISNCLSVQPFETPFGRKTRIDQTTCNFDYSCIEGDCPSFIVVDTNSRRLTRRRSKHNRVDKKAHLDQTLAIDLPEPKAEVDCDDFNVRLAGIGGTGVVTVAQILGTAAMLDGYFVHGLDQTGLSQKAGPVVSDLRMTRSPFDSSSRIGSFEADALLALDQLVAASPIGLDAASTKTVVVGSSSLTPTGTMISNPEMQTPSTAILAEWIAAVSCREQQTWADATNVTTKLLGNSMSSNVFVVGMAAQSGALPLSIANLEQAIRLNGAAVDANIQAFTLGRIAVAAPLRLSEALAAVGQPAENHPQWISAQVKQIENSAENQEAAIRFASDLIGHSNIDYAKRYLAVIEKASKVDGVLGAQGKFVEHVIRQAYHLMAYKDEYEVARLLLLEAPKRDAVMIAGEHSRISFLLHPPVLRSLGMSRKIKFPEWTMPMFKVLASLKRLRATRFDPFRYTAVRRTELQLRDEYEKIINDICVRPESYGLDKALRIAELPNMIRGYEQIKMTRVAQYETQLKALVA